MSKLMFCLPEALHVHVNPAAGIAVIPENISIYTRLYVLHVRVNPEAGITRFRFKLNTLTQIYSHVHVIPEAEITADR